MRTLFRIRFFGPQSDNLKSKIENRKWAGVFAIALAFVFGEAVAKAQQPGKIFRIGFLDSSTASGMAVLVDAFHQELSKLGWIEGGLMSYGADFEDLYRRAAVYVDKILKGAKPADLPVQQATKFEFVVNLKAAKEIRSDNPESSARTGE
jgi:hypothetical protein